MNQHEEISAWMDGEAGPGRTEALTRTVLQDAESRARWRDWHLIGDVMRSAALSRQAGLANSVAEALEREPVHLSTPRTRGPQRPAAPVRRKMPRAAAGAAVAAAMAFVVFVTVAPQMQESAGSGQLAQGSSNPQAPDVQAPAMMVSNPEVFRAVSAVPALKYKPESLKGFHVVGVYERPGQSGVEMRRYVLSDGVATVTVLVAPKAGPATLGDQPHRTGAVSMLSRDIQDVRLTVLGDVPPDALRQFVQTIEWKNTP